jgi:hypothetical protein
MQTNCAALAGLELFSLPTQGFGRFASSTLGFAASRFQRFIPLSLMRMPLRGRYVCLIFARAPVHPSLKGKPAGE